MSARQIIVVPRGFLASVESFVSTVFELSYVGACLFDREALSARGDLDQLVMVQSKLMADQPNEYAFGVFTALSPTFLAFTIAESPDLLRAAMFSEDIYRSLNAFLPSSHRFESLGFGSLGNILQREPTIQRDALNIRRLIACVALCHEMGHLLVDEACRQAESVPGHEALGHDRNEKLADGFGTLIFYRLKEAGLLSLVLDGEAVSHGAFVNALAAFNAWSLATCLVRVSVAQSQKNERAKSEAMAALAHVAGRWKRNAEMLIEAEGESANGDGNFGLAETLFACWSFPCGELLRQLFLSIGLRVDEELAFRALYELDDPKSEICRTIATAAFD